MNNVLTSPPIDILSSEGLLCLSRADALNLARLLAADPAQCFHFPTDCGRRAELMIGRLLSAGLPAEIVHRAFIHAPEPPDMDGARMTQCHPAGSSLRKLVETARQIGRNHYEFMDEAVEIEFFLKDHAFINDKNNPHGHVYDLPELGPRTGFAFHHSGESYAILQNHATIALSVRNEPSGAVERLVVDPHLTRPVRLLSFAEWKAIQGNDDAIMLSGPVGHEADIVCEPGALSHASVENLRAALFETVPDLDVGDGGPLSIDDMRAIMHGLDGHTRDAIALKLLPGTADFNVRSCCYSTDADIERNDSRVAHDWNSLDAAGRRQRCDEWVAYLRPLAFLDRQWQKAFYETTAPASDRRATAYPGLGLK